MRRLIAPSAHAIPAVGPNGAPTCEIDARVPFTGLSVVEMGRALGGIGDEAVRQRELDGRLFSISRAGHVSGREYPAFQTWSGIQGAPLEAVLETLSKSANQDDNISSLAYGFFAGTTDLLGYLTPIEALLGKLIATRELGDEVRTFLASPESERLQAVIEAAEAHASAACAW